MSRPVTVTVCRTCRPEGSADAIEPPGAGFGRAVAEAAQARGADGRVAVRAIACLSACSRACAATVSGEGKFGYVIGGLSESDADDLVTFALAHAESADGIPPWRARPERIRKNTVARLPPHGGEHALIEDVAMLEALTPRQ